MILDDCANLILQITKRYGKDCYLQMELNMQNRHRKHRQSRHFCLWTISMKAEMKDAEVLGEIKMEQMIAKRRIIAVNMNGFVGRRSI